MAILIRLTLVVMRAPTLSRRILEGLDELALDGGDKAHHLTLAPAAACGIDFPSTYYDAMMTPKGEMECGEPTKSMRGAVCCLVARRPTL